MVEKHLVQGSYWLGIACSVVALVWRGLEFLKVTPEEFGTLRYTTFYKGGVLFLLISIAAAGNTWLKNQKA